MRLALFALVNAILAGVFGYYAYAQGMTAGEIAFTVVLVLVVIQLAYVIWLVAISFLKREDDTAKTKTAETFVPGPARRLSGAQSLSRNQTR